MSVLDEPELPLDPEPEDPEPELLEPEELEPVDPEELEPDEPDEPELDEPDVPEPDDPDEPEPDEPDPEELDPLPEEPEPLLAEDELDPWLACATVSLATLLQPVGMYARATAAARSSAAERENDVMRPPAQGCAGSPQANSPGRGRFRRAAIELRLRQDSEVTSEVMHRQ